MDENTNNDQQAPDTGVPTTDDNQMPEVENDDSGAAVEGGETTPETVEPAAPVEGGDEGNEESSDEQTV